MGAGKSAIEQTFQKKDKIVNHRLPKRKKNLTAKEKRKGDMKNL